MRALIYILVVFSFIVVSEVSYSQDIRTTDLKVTDLLSRVNSTDTLATNKLALQMLSLGESGIREICNRVLPSGNSDDSKPRFSVMSLTGYLSKSGKENEKAVWENICISYATGQTDYTIRDFFMKQLQVIGSEKSAIAVKGYLSDKNICGPALAVISSAGGRYTVDILSEALKNQTLPCAAGVMNILSGLKSDIALNEFIYWAGDKNKSVQAAALKALAITGSPKAYPVLIKAARDAGYKWEQSGAVESLINYAGIIRAKGDTITMVKICKLLLSKCNDRSSIKYKTAALEMLVDFYGYRALPYILEATTYPDKSYRIAAYKFSLSFKGETTTRKWIELFPSARTEIKPEIINLLGQRNDKLALPLITASLSDPDVEVRKEAAQALAMIQGADAIPQLLEYIVRFTSAGDQLAAQGALKKVLDPRGMELMIKALNEGPDVAKRSIIDLVAWGKGKNFFDDVMKFTSSEKPVLRVSAYKALVELAAPEYLNKLLDLLFSTDEPLLISYTQQAIVNAVKQSGDTNQNLTLITDALQTTKQKDKIIPVLAKIGGPVSLAAVYKQFDKGDSHVRDICFRVLANWKDYSSASALFEICSSGNKTFEAPAFESYVSKVKSAPVTEEQKLILFRKIMPYAFTAERMNEILNETGRIKTYQAMVFAAGYLDDSLTSAAAARAVMYIAIPSGEARAGLYGSDTRKILGKAVNLIKGKQSEYEKEVISNYIKTMPPDEGFVSMFNGKDLSGWQGWVGNPVLRTGMKPAELAGKQKDADKKMTEIWSVRNGRLCSDRKGDNICSVMEYGDFEMLIDWRIRPKGEGGISLRGTPMIQITDTSLHGNISHPGSGGPVNNLTNQNYPLLPADNPAGEWNTFRILMVGAKVSVWLNGILVLNDIIYENSWNRNLPIFAKGRIELQSIGNGMEFRDIFIREINDKDYNLTAEEKTSGFVALFNGRNLNGWTGDTISYGVTGGSIEAKPLKGPSSNLYSDKNYSDFNLRFEFQLTPAARNGLGIRISDNNPVTGILIPILDDTAPVNAILQPDEHTGSVYGLIPAKTGFLKPAGEWNKADIYVKGSQIKVTLNGTVVLDGNIAVAIDKGSLDRVIQPGLGNKTGRISFQGNGSLVKFRNIRIKEIIQP
jgi:HEAT repeat protein